MTNALSNLKQEYNKLLERFNKAEVYFKDENVPQSEKDKHIPLYTEIVIAMSKLINEYEKLTGEDMTNELALEGFKEGDTN